jgi:hypothetical protein
MPLNSFDAAEKKRDAERKDRQELARRAIVKLREVTIERVRQMTMWSILRGFTPVLIDQAWADAARLVERSRGIDAGSLKDRAGGMADADQVSLWCELLAARVAVNFSGNYHRIDKDDRDFFKRAGVDLDAIATEIKEEKKKPPAKNGAASTNGKHTNGRAPRLDFHDTPLDQLRLDGVMWGNLTRPIAALEKGGIITVGDALGLMDRLGTSLADALATIQGVGKPASEQIFGGIQRYTISQRAKEVANA